METNEIGVASVIGELVKNSIDARCTVVQVEFNGSFDVRVIDDGCGFDEQTMQDVGERQLYFSDRSQRTRFRYGRHGKFILTIAQLTTEIYIESIKHNCDIRLYKTIIANKSVYKVFETDRKYKDCLVKTSQGSMVVLNSLNLSVGDAAALKTKIIRSVVELALINFQIDVSVKDTATQQTLYESYRTKNLFDKFEQYLESNQFFSKIQSVSCEKHDVKVELLICADATSGKAFQFVYFNRLSDQDGKWTKLINKLCKKRIENDLNSKCPVYLVNICAEHYSDNQLANNVLIDNCIRKCVEQLSHPPSTSCVVQPTISKDAIANSNKRKQEGHAASSQQGNGHGDVTKLQGVHLGDWIFNNSCENYEILNKGREMYRKKVCENWVISLEKPKPKDINDSLASVVLQSNIQPNGVVVKPKSNVRPDDHLFKKPKPKAGKRTTTNKRDIKPTSRVSTQIYKPSQQVQAFDSSRLIRASRKLIFKSATQDKPKKSTKSRLEVDRPKILRRDSERMPAKQSENLSAFYRIDAVRNVTFESLNDANGLNNPNGLNERLHEALPPRAYIPDVPDVEQRSDHFQIYRSKNTLDFQLHKSNRATNFNITSSSSIAIHAMKADPFMGFLETDACEPNSLSNLFESNVTSASKMAHSIPRSEPNRRSGSSIYSERSEVRYRQHRNDSIRTHYRQQTFCSFNSDNPNQNERMRSGEDTKSRRPKSMQSSTDAGSAVVPAGRQNSSLGLLNDEVRQSGWPVTININFGQPK